MENKKGNATPGSTVQTAKNTAYLSAEGHFGELLKGERNTLQCRQSLSRLIQYSFGKFFEEEKQDQDPTVAIAIHDGLTVLSYLEEVQ